MNRVWSAVRNLVFILASTLAACSSEKPRELSLIGDPEPDKAQQEADRLRKLQLIRVVDPATGDVVEMETWKVVSMVPGLCQLCDPPSTDPEIQCRQLLCQPREFACRAKVLLSAALPQATELFLDPGTFAEEFPGDPEVVVVPMQGPGANASLAGAALDQAHQAMHWTNTFLINLFDNGISYQEGGQNHDCLNLPPTLETATSLFADTYYMSREAYKVAVDAALAVSDAQLGSTPSNDEAIARVFSSPALSRAAAAHLMVGGNAGILGDTNWSYCTERLDPDVQAAIAVFRDAAMDPNAMLDTGELNTDDLLNYPDGSYGTVKERLSSFYGQEMAETVQEHFKLETTAFARARGYLVDEIQTFGRSRTAQLPPRLTPSGDPSPWSRFAAVATRPVDAPPTQFAGVARFLNDTTQFESWPADYQGYLSVSWPQFLGYLPEAHFIDVAMSTATRWLDEQDDVPAAFRGRALAPLSLLMASKERLGRLNLDGAYVDAHGFAPTDGLLFGVGDDALRCAVEGHIEGVACELFSSNYATRALEDPPNRARVIPLNMSYNPAKGFTTVASGGMWDTGRPAGRYYLLRPKRPELGVKPGNYESILAVTLGDWGDPQLRSYPITPELDRRVNDILAPSPKWCAMPRMSCSGALFDERIPLDDELASDQDGIESSWRHYLTLAKEAALRADELGEEYINAGLGQNQRLEEVELRVEQQRQRADDEIANLQNICGSETDPRKLLEFLSSDGKNAEWATGQTCTQDTDCWNGTCLPEGHCTLDLEKLANGWGEHYPDLTRVARCISDADVVPVVSLGTVPLCVWRSTSDPNLICEDGVPGECPRLKLGGESCETLMPLAPEGPRPAGTEVLATEPLEYFDSESDDGTDARRCEVLAQARDIPTLATTEYDQIHSRNWLAWPFLNENVKRLGWQQRYPNYAAITLDGSPVYQTGTTTTGPESDGWPCQQPTPSECIGKSSLFCQFGDCQDYNERTKRAEMMFRAFSAAHAWVTMSRCLGSTTFKAGSYFKFVDGTPATWDFVSSDLFNVYPDTPVYRWRRLNPNPKQDGKPFMRSADFWDSSPGGWFTDSMYFTAANTQCASHDWLFRTLSKQAGITHPKPWVKPYFGNAKVGFDGAQLPPHFQINLTDADVLNGLELLCQASSTVPQINLSVPPVISSIADMAGVSRYMQWLGKAIRSRASLSVFANVPKITFDALKEESSVGAFPQFGGQLGQSLARLRGSLVQIRETGLPLANEIQQFGYDVDELRILIEKSNVGADLAQIEFSATMVQQVANCATAIGDGMSSIAGASNPYSAIVGGIGASISSTAACANSIAQINFASKIAELQGRLQELDADLAIADFGSRFGTRSTNLQTLALKLAEAQEQFDAALAEVEALRQQARSSLARATYLSTYQAEQEAKVTTVLGNLYDGKQRRYVDALSRAKRMAFLAKRAIEQRLGIRLADMREDLPLVEAPATWEAGVCTLSGLSFETLQEASPNAAASFANGFISDYVTRLENTVESYRLENNFHEGTDTAVISLRDDLLNVRAECPTPVSNLLYHAGQLNEQGAPGWEFEDCSTEIVEGVEVNAADCVSVRGLTNKPEFQEPERAAATGYELARGIGATQDAAIVQKLRLEPGRYRFSWYATEDFGQPTIRGDVAIDPEDSPIGPDFNGWSRHYRIFSVPVVAEEPDSEVRVGFQPPASPEFMRIAAPMLEKLPDYEQSFALKPFLNTGDTLTQELPTCEDTHGDNFRAKHWVRRCLRLCADGFSSECSGEQQQTFCFQEASFAINQRDLQLGNANSYSGFARGNFNYRIENIGLNFVGSGTRDCGNAELPSTCGAAGYIPYTIEHNGPFFVRNHQGADVESLVFDGRIEHARGLAAERYLTNPLSPTDNDLISQYTRTELQGRPLDGSFVIRVWEDPGVRFEGIEDVQVVLNYRYWTRFD